MQKGLILTTSLMFISSLSLSIMQLIQPSDNTADFVGSSEWVAIEFFIFSELVFAFFTMWIIFVMTSFNERTIDKEEPLSLQYLLISLVFFNDFQKALFIKIVAESIRYNSSQAAVIANNLRFTVLALETMFMVIPLRHNLAVHNLEVQ